MDLAIALAGDGSARELQQVRLKLRFEDRSILRTEQRQAGLANCWFLVDRHLRSISDLASQISVAFGLLNSCPHGITLRMENFTLPPPQSVCLLKDKDIVSVNKKLVTTNAAAHQQIKHAYSSSFSFDKIAAPLGVKAPAIQEFEMETGGYESEQEEENERVVARQKDKALKPNTTKSKEKKRKREKMERADDKGKTQLQVVPYTGRLTREEKEKKTKKPKLMVQQDDRKAKEKKKDKKAKEKKKDKKANKSGFGTLEEDKHESDEVEACVKQRGPDSSAAVKPPQKKKKQAIMADVQSEHLRAQQQRVLKSNCKTVSLSNSSSDEKTADEERESALPIEGEHVKKLSRSTLRKKAKRRWKREHGELAKKPSDKVGDESRKDADNMDVAKHAQASLNFTAKQEDDGDAEEERLPRVVRPGHIRFEPLDEDVDDGLHSQHPLPLLGWSNGISKRKGQNWGQEKAKRGYKSLEVIDNMETCHTPELKFEALPLLKGTPQCGDIIAYRIVELTSSFCPELSEYRVGKVIDLASQSGVVKLAEVPNYPLQKKPGVDDEDHDAETDEHTWVGSLYDKEGFLETELSSLLDIRVVEASKQETRGIEPTKQASPELPTTVDNDTPLNSSTVARVSTDNDATTSIISSIMAATQKDADNKMSQEATPHPSEPGVPRSETSPIPFQDWPELFDVIERKKRELGDKGDGARSSGAVELDRANEGDGVPASVTVEPDRANGCSHTLSNSKKEASAGKARGWHKRAGGLGATIALLRSQSSQ